ncbi:hypothetical protein KDL01_34170, partial [Actinospica durhamensis]
MSSSGLIYAFIVGAWAVYLVPMWLRREDELNEARKTQRYTTAIKVLSHKESFERRYGRVQDGTESAETAQAEARLPVAVGQGAAPEAGRETLERVRAKERGQAKGPSPRDTSRERGAAASASAGRGAKPASGHASAHTPAATPGRKAVPADASARRSVVHASVSEGHGAASPSAPMTATSPTVRARRRRVVGVLFAVTSLGALVSMDLGLQYVWAMLVPAAVLSGYIAWVRKDERARAAERARRHVAAVRAAREAHTAREAERREQEQREQEREQQTQRERVQAVRVLSEREEQARRDAALRRRAAAARARAERRSG